MDLKALAKEIINGKRLKRGDDLSFFENCDLESLCEGANEIRKALFGNKADLCTIVNAKSGACGENCAYCAQSAHHKTSCEVYGFLGEEKITNEALSNYSEGVDRFALVTAGKSLCGADFEKALMTFRHIHEKCPTLRLCASFGFMTSEQFALLKEAGVSRYHDNIETSRQFFKSICTTHTFDEKISAIKAALSAGLEVCSGGIIGLGESFSDRIDMALTLSELGIRSIPINALMAIKGTPLENQKPLSDEEIRRAIATFRYINPEADIRLAGGRKLMKDNGRAAFLGGASATITGNMLTTSGSTIKSDREMLKSMRFEVIDA